MTDITMTLKELLRKQELDVEISNRSNDGCEKEQYTETDLVYMLLKGADYGIRCVFDQPGGKRH